MSGWRVLCKISKLLILLAFIIEKNLDTPTLPLLTFAQKVSTVLPPLELFSLERKGHLLPGGLFVCDLRRALWKRIHHGDTESQRKSFSARSGERNSLGRVRERRAPDRASRERGVQQTKRSGGVVATLRIMEPTIGLEPMTCRLRIDCSTN